MRALFLLLICLVLATGCGVHRTLTITSEPPGALVYLNGLEVGRTPVQRDFVWYGTYDVQLRKDGFETLKTRGKVIAPWWQWVPIDLFAELMPFHLHDRQSMHFTLEPQLQVAADPDVKRKAGLIHFAADLARDYGFTDVDGRVPDFPGMFDAQVKDMTAAELDDHGRYLMWARYCQIHHDPARRDLAVQLATALGLEDLGPGRVPVVARI